MGLVFIAGDYPSHPVEHKEARESNHKTTGKVIVHITSPLQHALGYRLSQDVLILQVALGYALEGMLNTFEVHLSSETTPTLEVGPETQSNGGHTGIEQDVLRSLTHSDNVGR